MLTSANNVNVASSSAITLDTINMNGRLTVAANGLTTVNNLLANTGMDLNAGTGDLNINNYKRKFVTSLTKYHKTQTPL